jgi:hypothetical protein
MKHRVGFLFLCMLVCMPWYSADAFLVTLNDQQKKEALKQGSEQGFNVIKYVNQRYKFGEGELFDESGILRTKWSKLMLISGRMAVKNLKPTEKEQLVILSDTALQIDLLAYGDRMGFANDYKVYLIQKDKQIQPDKISAADVAYSPSKSGGVTTGFPQYRALVRSYFDYDKINPSGEAEVVLIKDNKKVVFKVNFADYK